MEIKILKPRKALNKAFLKVKPLRSEIECFKTNLSLLLDRINNSESEEFHKNLISDFLKDTYYKQNHFINTKGRNDLVIHNGNNANSTVGVIIETKNPTNRAEMLALNNINVKAFHELVLYYLRERITHKNIEIKYLIATNIFEWYIFDSTIFDRLFAQNKHLVKQFNDFEGGRLADTKTDFFYKQVAEPFIADIKQDIEFTWLDIRNYEKRLHNDNRTDDNKLIALFKLLSPEHLLKLPFANDSNSLDKQFYSELLHIIGLTETKEGSKKLIGRKKEGDRNSGSLLENAIIQLDSHDKISRLKNASQYGVTLQERLFNVGLELCITWINRILFSKLLEAQLVAWHKGDKSFTFLNIEKIKDYDDLNSLFFQVLARKENERIQDVKTVFAKIPYLNSSLFEPSEIEHSTLFISNLRNDRTIPLFSSTILKDQNGKKRTGDILPLEYLFEFLNAYDFAGEGSEEIQEENKTLINASVLGLIFEKINGYKEGSYFTPGFITMYMCRETIRKAVIQKFKDAKGWNCESLEGISDKINDRTEANNIINSLKICDPAVGSGHFLVSALNEIIAIKSELGILLDFNGKPIRDYLVEVINDELFITDKETDEVFYYLAPTPRKESHLKYLPDSEKFSFTANQLPIRQIIQQSVFNEKQTIIENCLFGVDINPNSVKICRLRLWIELLKSAYYTPESNFTGLETLPNIDINIKCGNSLVSRYPLDANLKAALRKSKWSIDSYRVAISTYRNAKNKDIKREMEQLILKIKQDFTSEIRANDPVKTRLDKLANELYNRFTGSFLFEPEAPYGQTEKQLAKKRKKEQEKLEQEINELTTKIEEIKGNKIYENAFEWRFEFPEVLNDEGDFVGFDVVVANPPYGVKHNNGEKKYYLQNFFTSDDIYTSFIEQSKKISKNNANIGLITPITWLTGPNYLKTRKLLFSDFSLVKAINLPYNIFIDAYVDTGIYLFKKASVDKIMVFEFSPKAKTDFHSLLKIEFKELHRNNLKIKEDLKININEGGNSIFSKLDSFDQRLNNYSTTARGILANKVDYQAKANEISNKKVFIGNLNRYKIDENFCFIEYGNNLKEKPGNYEFFTGERILVRRIINRQFRVMAVLTQEEFVCKKDIYIIKLINNTFDAKFVLGLLNSKLFSYYKTKNSGSAKKDDFTQITLQDIRQLPIPSATKDQETKICELVSNQMNAATQNGNTDPEIDQQIDQLVYQLYNLTDEEIKIIENF